MVVVLQRGQRDCTGKVTAPQSSQRLPMSCGSSDGQVNTSAMGFCICSSRCPSRAATVAPETSRCLGEPIHCGAWTWP